MIQIDMDTTMHPTEQRMGGMTVEEQAAIDAADGSVSARVGRFAGSKTILPRSAWRRACGRSENL
jgi:hypothetical protein